MKNLSIILGLLIFLPQTVFAQIKVLIIDGQNNHVVWPKSTIMMKQYLEATGLFSVEIQRTKVTWRGDKEEAYLALAGTEPTTDLEQPATDPGFKPKFGKYDVVVSNFGWKAAPWPASTRKKFDKFVAKGGGFVSVHAADNSFPEWPAYNKMIGIGGWGDRNEKDGPYVYYTNEGKLARDASPGNAGQHGALHEFPVTIRDKEHPITKGMPDVWLTTADECYAKLRGPAEQLKVLATGKDQSEKAPTDRHEPVMMVINYGKGRVFHTTLGHNTQSFEGVGFIYSFLRGVEWAATGSVSQQLPEDFPGPETAASRKFVLKKGK
ncbi:ThuA domain-containing protein [Neolewinella persica]|uniref:ThuA domain-containing protein n=1 Tax=Neolewinella persica TaxID=70998 RepID=UPI000370F4B8|nr:ThuA domain-containing protein [Neolewinella persica]